MVSLLTFLFWGTSRVHLHHVLFHLLHFLKHKMTPSFYHLSMSLNQALSPSLQQISQGLHKEKLSTTSRVATQRAGL